MRSVWGILCVVLVVALAAGAVAGEKREGTRPERASGTFVSATVEGGTVTLKLRTGEGDEEKTFELAAQVTVMYAEREGKKQARYIRAGAGRPGKAPVGALTARGTIAKMELQGEGVVLTLKTEGGEPAEQQFALPQKLGVMYREAEGKLTAMGIMARSGGPREKKGEGKGREGRGRKGEKPPDNM